MSQRIEMWGRWKAGQSLHEIGRAVGKSHVVIQLLLARHGGIAPPTRRHARLTLTLAEREDISRGIASGSSIRGSPKVSSEQYRRWAERSPAMAGDLSIEPKTHREGRLSRVE